MMDRINGRRGRGRWPLPRVALAALLLTAPLAGCDELLEVEDPDVATGESLATPEAFPAVVGGALSEMREALNDFGSALIQDVGLFTDEYISSGTFTTRVEVDRRSINPVDNSEIEDLYLDMHQARAAARRAAEMGEQIGDVTGGRALGRALEGYMNIYFAENFCSGVPFSSVENGQLVFGPPQSTEEMLRGAVALFEQALQASPTAESRNLARIGLARALLNLGEFERAAQVAAQVPTNFVFFVEHSENQPNGLYNISRNGRWSQANDEGQNGLLFRSAMDPRAPWVRDGVGFDGSTPLFLEFKYNSRQSDVPIASGIEARLIEAEALLNKGQSGAYLPVLNSLRNDSQLLLARLSVPVVPGFDRTLEPLTDPGAPRERVNQLFEERAFWLFSTAHRLGDMRRLMRQYGRAESEVFPVGEYHKQGDYGNQVSFPVPIEETNNPNFQLADCDPTQP